MYGIVLCLYFDLNRYMISHCRMQYFANNINNFKPLTSRPSGLCYAPLHRLEWHPVSLLSLGLVAWMAYNGWVISPSTVAGILNALYPLPFVKVQYVGCNMLMFSLDGYQLWFPVGSSFISGAVIRKALVTIYIQFISLLVAYSSLPAAAVLCLTPYS